MANSLRSPRRWRNGAPSTSAATWHVRCLSRNNRSDGVEATEASMSALAAASEQLAYWRLECEKARQAGDHERLARCERFIHQCELVISALKERGDDA